MKVKRFRAENFRNINFCDIEFSQGINLFLGNNAEGKTNAIEGIYLFSRGKSFRGAEEKDLKKINEEGFRIFLEYEDKNGIQSLEYASFGREKRKKKNGYIIKKLTEFIGNFKAVLFYPDNLELVKDGPEKRREFLNIAISLCYTYYISEYSFYKEALENRNKLLKKASKGEYVDNEELICWSNVLAEHATEIYLIRKEYVKKLNYYSNIIQKELSGQKEELNIIYKSDIEEEISNKEKIKEIYKNVFTSSLEKERIVGTSLYGPHRDDLIIELNGNLARNFASQGQQRSIVLAMKLSEGEIIKEIFDEYPVFLFDDVLSELDEKRINYVMKALSEKQVIITSCKKENFKDISFNLIEVKGGNYVFTHR